MERELIISFKDVSTCLEQLKEFGIEVTPATENFIREVHSATKTVIAFMPLKFMPEICYRAANRIISSIEMETSERFVKYKKSNYEI